MSTSKNAKSLYDEVPVQLFGGLMPNVVGCTVAAWL